MIVSYKKGDFFGVKHMISFICSMVPEPDDRAFMVAVYEEYRGLMFSTAHRYADSMDDCNEIVQDGITKLIERIPLLRKMESYILAGYVAACIRNTAINFLRHRGSERAKFRSLDDDTAPELEVSTHPIDLWLDVESRRECLAAAWAVLSPDDKLLLEGRYILGYSDQELAKQLNCKPASIRMKLTRARRRAAKEIEAYREKGEK